MGCAIGIVLNSLDFGGNTVFGALKVNFSVVLFVTASNVTRCNTAEVIPPSRLSFFSLVRVHEAFLYEGLQ